MLARRDTIHAGCVDRLVFADLVQLTLQRKKPSPDRYFQILYTRTPSGEIGQLRLLQSEDSANPRHFVKDVQKESIRQIEIRFETVNRDNHLVGVATVTAAEGEFWNVDDGYLGERDNAISEAGEPAGHKLIFPLHFLVSYVYINNY